MDTDTKVTRWNGEVGDQSEKTERQSQSSSDTPADSDNNSGIMCGDFSPHAGSVASGRSCTNCLVDFSRGRGYASADRQTLDALKVHRDTEANFVKCQPPRDSRRACQSTGRTTADSPGRIRRPRICDGVSQPAPSKTGVARRRPQNYPWQNRFVAKGHFDRNRVKSSCFNCIRRWREVLSNSLKMRSQFSSDFFVRRKPLKLMILMSFLPPAAPTDCQGPI